MRILMRRCNRCSGCCAVNCGLCRECQDKPAFGGKGIRKKLCRARRCQNPQSAKAAAAKAATVSRTADLLELMLPGGRQELVDREFAAPALPTATAVAATHAVGGSVASSSPPSPTSAELLERARAQLVPLGSRGVPTNDATPSFCALSSPNCDFAVTAGTPEARDTTSEALRVLAALCDPHADTDASGGSSGGGGEEGGGGGEEGGAGECRGDYGEASDRWDRGPQPEDEMEELLGELLSSLESDDLLSQPSVSPSTSLGDAASTTTTSSTTTTAATTTSSPGESTRPVSSLTPLQASCHRIGSLIELEFRSLAAGADLPREQQLRLFGAAAADRSAVLLRLQAVLHAMVSNLATSSAGSNDPAAVAAVLRIVTAAEVTLADGSDLPVPPPLLPALAAAMRADTAQRLGLPALPRQSALAPVPSPLPSPPEPTLANSPLTKSPLLSLPRRKPRTGRLATPGYLVAALGRRVGGSVRFWARHRLLGQGLPLPGGGVCGYSATPERVQAGALCIFWCQILLLRAAEERGFLTETADGWTPLGDGEGSNLIASVSTLAVVLLGGYFVRVAFGMRAAARRARFLARAQLFTWGVWTCTNVARLLKAFLRQEEELLEDIESVLGAMCSDQGESALQQSVLIELGLLSPLLGRSLRIPAGFMLANIGLTLMSAGRLGWLFPSHSYPTRMAHCLIAPYIGSFVASALLLCATGVLPWRARAGGGESLGSPRGPHRAT